MSHRSFEAFRSRAIFEKGIGHVVVLRKKGNGTYEAGVFLVDVFCLGVKNAFFTGTGASEEQELLSSVFHEDDPWERVAPACARKLVEDATAYARNLGLSPHPDIKKASRVLGGINSAECREVFTF